MTTAVARRGPGRPFKLTPEVKEILLEAIGVGAPIRSACAVAGVAEPTFHQWLQRARGEHPSRDSTPELVEFAAAVERAKGHGDLRLLKSIDECVVGRLCETCDGKGSIEGEERPMRCPACSGQGKSIRPDGRLALMVLERRHPEFRKTERVEVSATVTVEARVTALAVDVASMSPAQLMAMAPRKVIEEG